MGLVAGDFSVGLRPVVPAFQVGEVKLAEGLAVVGADARDGVGIANASDGWKLIAEVITTGS